MGMLALDVVGNRKATLLQSSSPLSAGVDAAAQ